MNYKEMLHAYFQTENIVKMLVAVEMESSLNCIDSENLNSLTEEQQNVLFEECYNSYLDSDYGSVFDACYDVCVRVHIAIDEEGKTFEECFQLN